MEESIQVFHITPDLSGRAKGDIKRWRAEGEYNKAFHKVLEQYPGARCKNCGGAGFIMVSFTRAGPFDAVPNHRPGETLTWFEGNNQAGKGWYITNKTISYPCHHCDSANAKQDEPRDTSRVKPETIQAELREHWAE